MRVSQYIALELGEGPLYESLCEIFDVDYAPTSLHTLFASVPALLDGDGGHLLALTTNDDDALERAFDSAGAPYDGAVDREQHDNDSYVITEDDCIDYLTHMTTEALIPAPLLAKLQHSHFLFLGYGVRDWNPGRIWREQPLRLRSWSNRRNVEVLDVLLSTCVRELSTQLARAAEEAA